jgi:hypothetical protein
MPLAFPPLAQRNAFHRDARQQSQIGLGQRRGTVPVEFAIVFCGCFAALASRTGKSLSRCAVEMNIHRCRFRPKVSVYNNNLLCSFSDCSRLRLKLRRTGTRFVGGLAPLKLCAHFLETRSKSFNLRLLLGYCRLLFLHLAMCF